MKKFWNLMLVALVMMGAAACTETNDSVDASMESLSFYAEITNDATRADLEYDEENKVWNTVWEGNETIAVKDANGNIFNFSNTEEEKSKFTCTQYQRCNSANGAPFAPIPCICAWHRGK